jgi:hypothetical protein
MAPSAKDPTSLPSKAEISRRLRAALEHRQLSPGDLTRLLGRRDHAVHKWLKNDQGAGGSMPSFFNLVQICQVLDLDVYYFIQDAVRIDEFDMTSPTRQLSVLENIGDEDKTMAAVIASLPDELRDYVRTTVDVLISLMTGVNSRTTGSDRESPAKSSPITRVISTQTFRAISHAIATHHGTQTIQVFSGFPGIGMSVAAKVICMQQGIAYLDANLLQVSGLKNSLSQYATRSVVIDHAYSLSEEDLDAIADHIVGGGSVIALCQNTGSTAEVLQDRFSSQILTTEIPGMSLADALLLLSEMQYPLRQEIMIRVFQRTVPSVRQFLTVVETLRKSYRADEVEVSHLLPVFDELNK